MIRPANASRDGHPAALLVYVIALATIAVGSAVATALHNAPTLQHHVVQSVLCGLLLVEGHLLRVRLSYHGDHEDLNFVEAALAVLLVTHNAADVMVTTCIATGASMVLQRVRGLNKVVFNIASWSLAAVAGYGVYHAIAGSVSNNAGRLLGIGCGICVIFVANQLLLTTALWLDSHKMFWSQQSGQLRALIVGRLITAIGTVALGILLAAAALWSAWTVIFAFAPLVLLHWASKGYAEARADRFRLAGLQRITHALSVSMDMESAMPPFLAEARAAFEATRAELWLADNGHLTLSYDDGGPPVASDADQRSWVEDIVSRESQVYTSSTEQSGSTIVAPLRAGEKVYGAFCLLGRYGMEGFEAGELAVASALAAELVGFLERTRLVETVVEERAKLAQIVEQTSDGIVTLSPDGRISSWNRAMEQITGYFSIEMTGTAHLQLIRPTDEAGNEVALERWVDIAELPERIQIRTSSGEMRWLSCSFTRVAGTSKQEETLIVVARDVTAAHELERLKDDFVAVVSHELRTPLVPIKGWASMLLSRGDRMSDEQRQDALESIHAQAQRLERLILNILDSSRIEGGLDNAAASVDVSTVAARVVEEMLSSSQHRAIRLQGANERNVALGQPVWVERALANLLANALKYSPSASEVVMSIATEGNEIVVRVEDEGPGIPDGWAERIFERFERVPGSETQTGTGLGLYITRQLVTAMGGSVEVDTTSERGTTFVMRLRANAPLPGPRTGSSSPPGSLTLQ